MSAITSAANTDNMPGTEPISQKLKEDALHVPRDVPWWKDRKNIQAAQFYARLKGLILRSDATAENAAVNYPLTLQPHNFPQEFYEEMWALQPAVNSLVDAVSRDLEFLEEALARVIKVDDFTSKLFKLLKDSQCSNTKTVLGIHRVDYMMAYRKQAEATLLALKQTEVNTIAASQGSIAQGGIQDYHQYLHSRYFGQSKPLNIPNPSSTRAADGLAVAWKQYRNSDAYVLFVVQPKDWNIYDIHAVEFDLWTRYQVKSISRSIQELAADAELRDNETLFVSNREVAVVYFRTGYDPVHYSSEKDWSTRLLMERSRATICPSVAYQLVGTKKVQQALAAPGVLEKFIDDPDVVQRVRSTFAGLYSLDRNPEGDRNLAAALQRPDDFVLKCQREGGNTNIYGSEIRTLLASIESSDERENYILMDRIRPPTQHGVILRKSADEPFVYDNLFTEVGIYGVFVRHGDEVLLNENTGFIARTKPVTTTKDLVVHEAVAIDSVNLIPTAEFLALVAKEK